MKAAVSMLIYNKIPKLSKKSAEKSGQVFNAITTDTNMLVGIIRSPITLIIGPIQAIVGAYVMYKHIGWSATPGFLVIIFYIPFQAYMNKIWSDAR